MTAEEFEKLVHEGYDAIPRHLTDMLDNVAIVIEDEPSPRQLGSAHLHPGWTLFGLYEGVPQTSRANYTGVLPVLVPEKNHKDLEVSDGGSAQRLWMQTVLGGAGEDKTKVMQDLRDYCELDTLAMVKIYEFLLNVVKPGKTEPIQASLF